MCMRACVRVCMCVHACMYVCVHVCAIIIKGGDSTLKVEGLSLCYFWD